MVDCRYCRFYMSVKEMDEELKEQALVWIEKNRPGEFLRGYCLKYKRPITHFRGKCRGYVSREIKQYSLKKWIPGL